MVRRVALVTDSTAHLDAGETAHRGIAVVPLRVIVSGTSYDDGSPEVVRLVTEALLQGKSVTTSRPSPMDFLAAYREAARAGSEAAVSIHVSGDLSGTSDAARLGAVQAPLPVAVVDTRQIGMALGFVVSAAADAVARGAEVAEVVAVARARAATIETFVYVDTMEYLRRGGRIGAAQALLGSAFAVKPLLQVRNGQIEVLTKVRTTGRALAELERVTLASASTRPVEIGIHHLGVPERAAQLAARLRQQVPRLERLVTSEAGSAIGAHVGPGMLGLAVAPTEVRSNGT
ncbi:DegV family protein [Actinopolymorpha pittospori]|uniref:DegV family protein with EDD domain n=1 Tax=Actinopolymorpha pittospori TaxID=648752 RepID=A0A927RMB7_9ACTN|nr:DegV family protein with EDD domain [Actinopolymorpha pittospori]